MKIQTSLPWLITGTIVLTFYLIGITVPEETIKEVILRAGPYGVIVFILLTLLTYIFAPVSGSPFLFAGFFAFGPKAVLYTAVAIAVSVITNFWIARIWGRTLVEKLAGKKNLQKVDIFIHRHTLSTLILSRLLLNAFHDGVSYTFGLTSIRFKPYFTVSILAMIPNIIFWYLVSLKITSPLTYTLLHILAAYILLAFYLIWLFITASPKLRLLFRQVMKAKQGFKIPRINRRRST